MALQLFPIGNTASKVSTGSIDGNVYTMFEPNDGCRSHKIHTTLLTNFQDQTMLSRKKAEPYLTITYTYNNIFNREFKQIEHFVDEVDDALTSFYTIDWSRGEQPNLVASAGAWTVYVNDTRNYSATTNKKSNKAFIWNGSSWKMGVVTTVTAASSIVVTLSPNNRGSLTHSTIKKPLTMVYPVYEVRFADNVLSNFDKGEYWDDDSNDRGFLRSGMISFVSKYKV